MASSWAGCVAVSFLVLAGCSAKPNADADGTASGSDSGTGGPAANATLPMPVTLVRTLYLTPTGLTWELPAANTAPIRGSYSDLAAGFETNEFSSGPVANATVVENVDVRVQLWIEATTAPVVPSRQLDVGAWFGSSRSSPLSTLVALADPFMPGVPTLVEFDMQFSGKRGIFVPVGEALHFEFLAGMGQDDRAGMLRLHTGGDKASNLNLTVTDLPIDPTAASSMSASEVFTGEVMNVFSPTDCSEPPATVGDHEVTVPLNATKLEATLTRSSPATVQTDLDIDLLDGATGLTGGHTPRSEEGILLAGPTLAGLQGQTLTIRVTACSGGTSPYSVTVVMT